MTIRISDRQDYGLGVLLANQIHIFSKLPTAFRKTLLSFAWVLADRLSPGSTTFHPAWRIILLRLSFEMINLQVVTLRQISIVWPRATPLSRVFYGGTGYHSTSPTLPSSCG